MDKETGTQIEKNYESCNKNEQDRKVDKARLKRFNHLSINQWVRSASMRHSNPNLSWSYRFPIFRPPPCGSFLVTFIVVERGAMGYQIHPNPKQCCSE